jgi:hypothetical protein
MDNTNPMGNGFQPALTGMWAPAKASNGLPQTDRQQAEPRARRHDPATSHMAANEARTLASEHKAKVLRALKALGTAGKDQIARHTGLFGIQVSRRTSDLRDDGLIEATGELVKSDAGRKETAWRLTAAGAMAMEAAGKHDAREGGADGRS